MKQLLFIILSFINIISFSQTKEILFKGNIVDYRISDNNQYILTFDSLVFFIGNYIADSIDIKMNFGISLGRIATANYYFPDSTWFGKKILIHAKIFEDQFQIKPIYKQKVLGCPALTPSGNSFYFLENYYTENDNKYSLKNLFETLQNVDFILEGKNKRNKIILIDSLITNQNTPNFVKNYLIWNIVERDSDDYCLDKKREEIAYSCIGNSQMPIYVRIIAYRSLLINHTYISFGDNFLCLLSDLQNINNPKYMDFIPEIKNTLNSYIKFELEDENEILIKINKLNMENK